MKICCISNNYYHHQKATQHNRKQGRIRLIDSIDIIFSQSTLILKRNESMHPQNCIEILHTLGEKFVQLVITRGHQTDNNIHGQSGNGKEEEQNPCKFLTEIFKHPGKGFIFTYSSFLVGVPLITLLRFDFISNNE